MSNIRPGMSQSMAATLVMENELRIAVLALTKLAVEKFKNSKFFQKRKEMVIKRAERAAAYLGCKCGKLDEYIYNDSILLSVNGNCATERSTFCVRDSLKFPFNTKIFYESTSKRAMAEMIVANDPITIESIRQRAQVLAKKLFSEVPKPDSE